ncbi:MAG: porin family protein [Paramuribaculum sp.]|nr:porin family protein [Paramuribaculum sp.]
MKKFLLTLVAAATTAVSSWAVGPGDIAYGGNLTIAPVVESGVSLTNFGIGAKFQYGLAENLRAELDMDYFFKSSHIDIFDMAVNAHYLFNFSNDEAAIYPIVGIGFGALHTSYMGVSDSEARFLANIGVGAQYDFTDRLVGCIEWKYQYMSNFSRMPISVGIAYKF